MSQVARVRVGLGVALVTAGMIVTQLVLVPAPTWQSSSGRAQTLGNMLVIVACSAVGLLIITRVPGNGIGWVFSLVALVFQCGELAHAYALRAAASSSLPGAAGFALSVDLLFLSAVPPGATLLLLLFPRGQLPSPRWRLVVWALAIGTATAVVGLALTPRPLEYLPGVDNPIGLDGSGAVLEPIVQGAFLLVIGSFLAGAVSLWLRWQRAVTVERQQMRWMAYAASVAVVFFIVLQALPPLWGDIAGSSMAMLFPVATGIAIFRYRLYDIDRLISRTLVYGLLTAVLTLLYTGSVFLLGNLLDLGDGDSQVAVAASTLLVAALFQPLRRRLQQLVNRQFNRRRYDADLTVATFGSRLRDEIDLDELSTSLLTAVHATVEPAGASLWLCSTPDKRPAAAPLS